MDGIFTPTEHEEIGPLQTLIGKQGITHNDFLSCDKKYEDIARFKDVDFTTNFYKIKDEDTFCRVWGNGLGEIWGSKNIHFSTPTEKIDDYDIVRDRIQLPNMFYTIPFRVFLEIEKVDKDDETNYQIQMTENEDNTIQFIVFAKEFGRSTELMIHFRTFGWFRTPIYKFYYQPPTSSAKSKLRVYSNELNIDDILEHGEIAEYDFFYLSYQSDSTSIVVTDNAIANGIEYPAGSTIASWTNRDIRVTLQQKKPEAPPPPKEPDFKRLYNAYSIDFDQYPVFYFGNLYNNNTSTVTYELIFFTGGHTRRSDIQYDFEQPCKVFRHTHMYIRPEDAFFPSSQSEIIDKIIETIPPETTTPTDSKVYMKYTKAPAQNTGYSGPTGTAYTNFDLAETSKGWGQANAGKDPSGEYNYWVWKINDDGEIEYSDIGEPPTSD